MSIWYHLYVLKAKIWCLWYVLKTNIWCLWWFKSSIWYHLYVLQTSIQCHWYVLKTRLSIEIFFWSDVDFSEESKKYSATTTSYLSEAGKVVRKVLTHAAILNLVIFTGVLLEKNTAGIVREPLAVWESVQCQWDTSLNRVRPTNNVHLTASYKHYIQSGKEPDCVVTKYSVCIPQRDVTLCYRCCWPICV